jgi:hypothetical protein
LWLWPSQKSFFGTEIQNLMPILGHRFYQTKHPHYKTSQEALLSLVIWPVMPHFRLNLPQNDLIFHIISPQSDLFPLIRCFSLLNVIFLSFNLWIMPVVNRSSFGTFCVCTVWPFLTVQGYTNGQKRSETVEMQTGSNKVNGLKRLGTKSGKFSEK